MNGTRMYFWRSGLRFTSRDRTRASHLGTQQNQAFVFTPTHTATPGPCFVTPGPCLATTSYPPHGTNLVVPSESLSRKGDICGTKTVMRKKLKGKKEVMVSSNVAMRVKRNPKRHPSRHVTSPYTEGRLRKRMKIEEVAKEKWNEKNVRKRKRALVKKETKQEDNASLFLLSDTSHVKFNDDAKCEEARKSFSCPRCSEPIAIMYYVQYVEAGIDEPLVLLNVTKERLTRHQLCASLGKGNWISSDVINVFVAILTNNTKEMVPIGVSMMPVSWYLPTFFMIFIPMNEPGSHWYMVVVHVRKNYIEILDTLHTRAQKRARMAQVEKLKCTLALIMGEMVDEEYGKQFVKFKVDYADWVPTQPNGFDCGVLMLKMMLQHLTIFHHDLSSYDSEKERVKLIVCLIKSRQNLMWKTIMNVVKPFVIQEKGVETEKIEVVKDDVTLDLNDVVKDDVNLDFNDVVKDDVTLDFNDVVKDDDTFDFNDVVKSVNDVIQDVEKILNL